MISPDPETPAHTAEPHADHSSSADAYDPARAIPALKRLSELGRGHCGKICGFGHCPDRQLLRAMGLLEERQFRVCRCGEPCILQVNTTRVGLSREVADQIMVAVEDVA